MAPLSGLLLVGAVALVFDLSANGGLGGFGFFTFVCVLVAALYAGGTRNASQVTALACAVLLSAIWVFRESGWMRLSSSLLVVACLLAALTVARDRPVFDVRWVDTMVAAYDAIVSFLLMPAWLIRGSRRACPPVTRRGADITVRLVCLGLPLLLTIAALLAWSDAAFASLFSISMTAVMTHGVLFFIGLAIAGWFMRCAVVRDARVPTRASALRASFAETVAILGGIALLLGAFASVQIATALDDSGPVGKGSAAAYSAHARSGYFQLLAVVAIVVMTLVVFDRLAQHEHRWQRLTQIALSLAIVGLSIAIAGVALRRLAQYSEAFGLTMLRLVAIPAAAWMVILLVLVAVSVCGGRRRSWLPGVAGIALVAIWLGFAAINPQQVMVDYDFAHADEARLDLRYLTSLSSDATPALAAHVADLPLEEQALVRRRMCWRGDRPVGLAQLSVSQIKAQEALEAMCP
ncbi:MAG: DUF4173 domain-containing protein [Candidatus Nanopelagicales bacterium]|nr:DUF4173 domain-containing protein [Candidatus Nanopelagicales bacterium]MDZ4250019.1 DUF4173 domain-containing protein [Candidatus Nanopelagicales bacterium]